MSQNDFTIADAGGQTVLNDMNSALQALATMSSGSTAPSTTYAGQIWWDTTNNLIKRRNGANNGWINWLRFDGTKITPHEDQVSNLTAVTDRLAPDDEIAFYDVSNGGLRRVTAANSGLSVELDRQVVSGTPSAVDLVDDSGVDWSKYIIDFYNIVATNGSGTTLALRFSDDGGGTFESGSGYYAYVHNRALVSGGGSPGGANSASEIALTSSNISSSPSEQASGQAVIRKGNRTSGTINIGWNAGSSAYTQGMITCWQVIAGDVANAFRFFLDNSDTFANGIFVLRGMK